MSDADYQPQPGDVLLTADLAAVIWPALTDALVALEIIAMDGEVAQHSERALARLIARNVRRRLEGVPRPPDWVLPDPPAGA